MRPAFVILLLIFAIDLQCVFQTNSNFDPDCKLATLQNQPQRVDSCNANLTENGCKKRKIKPLITMFFANTTRKSLLPASTESACKWLKNYRKQSRECLNRRGLSEVLMDARKLATVECRKLFFFDRWDCTRVNNAMFRKISRETAFLQALSASALMFSIAKACSDGKIGGCHCLKRSYEKQKWHGCEDNTKFARRMTRRFLLGTKRQHNDTLTMNKAQLKQEIFENNINIGLKTVTENIYDYCICHGVSASCTVRTCWKMINHNFTTIAMHLKSKYKSAAMVMNDWTLQDDKLNAAEMDNQLFYLAHSPNFCATTRGRRCKDPSHCATLCCGRGFVERDVVVVNVECNCSWRNYTLACDKCQTSEVHFICK